MSDYVGTKMSGNGDILAFGKRLKELACLPSTDSS